MLSQNKEMKNISKERIEEDEEKNLQNKRYIVILRGKKYIRIY